MRIMLAAPILFATTTIGALFFAAAPTTATGEAAVKISPPLTHENLAVYLVRGTSIPGATPATLEEALAKGTVVVHETGNVRELKIENKGTEPVFIQFGDMVKGGRQDRVLTTSLLIPPASGQIAIGAYCVEQGRWSKRGTEDATKFSASSAQIFSREAKVAIARAPLDDSARPSATPGHVPRADRLAPLAYRGDRSDPQRPDANIAQRVQGRGEGRPSASGQGEVWRSVSAVQGMLGERLAAPVAADQSKTSLQLTIENEKLKEAQAGFVKALETKALDGDDVVGVVIAVNGRIASADIYPSNGLFRKMWPKLVRAAALEAFANRQGAPQPTPGVEDVEKFLADAQNGEVSERTLADIARHETRQSADVLKVEARTANGAWIHRNFLAAK